MPPQVGSGSLLPHPRSRSRRRLDPPVDYLVGPTGRILGQTPVQTVPITDDCEVDLTDPQQDRTSDLTVGETSIGQKGMKVA